MFFKPWSKHRNAFSYPTFCLVQKWHASALSVLMVQLFPSRKHMCKEWVFWGLLRKGQIKQSSLCLSCSGRRERAWKRERERADERREAARAETAGGCDEVTDWTRTETQRSGRARDTEQTRRWQILLDSFHQWISAFFILFFIYNKIINYF